MSELAEQIREKVTRPPTVTADGYGATEVNWWAAHASAALLAVMELHAPETEHSWEIYRPRWMPERAPSGPLCTHCSAGYEHQVPYPCRTVRTIAEKLGIEVDHG